MSISVKILVFIRFNKKTKKAIQTKKEKKSKEMKGSTCVDVSDFGVRENGGSVSGDGGGTPEVCVCLNGFDEILRARAGSERENSFAYWVCFFRLRLRGDWAKPNGATSSRSRI